ncbi:putative bifunctional diguanylate cyclase/phosphodiesterase [Methylogaea oryzae]|uniref:cyclic-guanylate-specific phosphodiesterase n=1 Tax=Methylogaea oryzae TaxID=1295382 RepID=A0A8D4VSE9_9GAMM|nr:EAL domain-containing protein [Methylogaea oryzae]BBL71515.1 hypothetical protein MoryE10_21210 [Methylogaea oryzae]
MKILLVEDNLPDAVLLRELLRSDWREPPELVHAIDMSDALRCVQREAFDVALLDLSLPDAFGDETFRRLNRQAPNLPIIALTGLDDETLATELAQAGAQDYLVKGHLDAGILHRAIRYAIERKRAEEKLRLAATVFESTLEAILITDANGAIISVNRAFCDITGYSESDVLGRNPNLLQSGRHRRGFFRKMRDALGRKGQWQGETWHRRKSGEIFPTWMNVSAVGYANGEVSHYVGVFTDITDLKHSEERLDYLAHHDTLTGLPNRLLFHERLREAALHARQNNRIIALMFLDLDRFKIVNDTLGHTVGDELLAAVAERLRNSVRASDTVARLGGDEFAVVVSDMTDGSDIAHRAQKIIDTLSSAFSVGGNEVFVTTSIGITLFPNDNGEWSKMVENADVAMYHAKQQGRNNYQFYTAEMNACAYDQLMLETSLRHALERDEFVLYYQPQIDMPSGDIVGVEALIRWNHPELGLVPPNDFIPLLEVTGLIVPVGEWVIRTACRQVRTWLDEGHPPLTMAVNLSARQFREQNLKSNIAAILAETNIPANLLELEITESIVMENVQETVEILRQFKDMGLKVAIDDFGTGASSLSYLKSFPVDTLKISHDFVLNLPADNDDAAIAKAVITLARNMSLGSVAEGVETSEQMDFLRLQQCERMQGYLFSKALPPEQMAALLEERRRAAAT